MNSAQAANAPVEITLGGKTYLVSQLTRADRQELNRWVQGKIVEVARLGLTGATAEERKEIMGLAFDRALVSTWSSITTDVCDRLAMIARLIWQYVKSRYPDVSQEDIAEALVANPNDITPIFDKLDFLYHNPAQQNPTTPAATPAPTTAAITTPAI